MSKALTMDELLAGSDITTLSAGEVVEGSITDVKKNEVWIDLEAQGVGGRTLLVQHGGRYVPWEDLASGRAIVERYAKQAKDIDDQATWRAICRDLARGLIELIAIMEPEAVIIGGSVGTYFDKYGSLLAEQLKKYDLPPVKLPELRQAQRPQEAVIYGCYDLAKQVLGHAKVAD